MVYFDSNSDVFLAKEYDTSFLFYNVPNFFFREIRTSDTFTEKKGILKLTELLLVVRVLGLLGWIGSGGGCGSCSGGPVLAGAAAGAAVRLVLRAQQVVQDVNDRGDIPLRLTVGVLQPVNQIE